MNRPSVRFHIYRAELPNLAETHLIVAPADEPARHHWGIHVATIESVTARHALQISLDHKGLRMPPGGMQSAGHGASFITFKHRRGR